MELICFALVLKTLTIVQNDAKYESLLENMNYYKNITIMSKQIQLSLS